MIAAPEAFSIFCAVTSTATSLMVVLTGLLFPSMMRSVFMRTIVSIAFCDFCGCFLYCFGYVSGAFCSAQGFIAFLFIRASWFITVGLALQLCSLVLFSRVYLTERVLHIASWGLTLFLSLIPLAGHFQPGADDYAYGKQWCTLAVGGYDDAILKTFDTYLLFYSVIPLVGSVAILILLSIIVRVVSVYRFNILSESSSNNRVRSLVFTIQLYPLSLLLTWLPYCIFLLYSDYALPVGSYTAEDGVIQLYLNAVGTLYGTFLGIVFFANSREARQRWFNMFRSAGQSTFTITIDDILESTIDEQSRLLSRSQSRSVVSDASSAISVNSRQKIQNLKTLQNQAKEGRSSDIECQNLQTNPLSLPVCSNATSKL